MASSFFGKGIPLGMNFDLGAERALDSRTIANTFSELQEHVDEGRAYVGLTVYVIDEDKKYTWNGTEWRKENTSGGSKNFVISTYDQVSTIKNEESFVGSLIYIESDANKSGEPNMYIIVSEELNEEGLYIPKEVKTISSFAKSMAPVLDYDTSIPEGKKIYTNKGENITLVFNFNGDNYGDGKYKIYKNGTILKTFSAPKGTVIADLGAIDTNGSYEITVTATDYFGIPAARTLKYQVIVGGVELESTFDKDLASSIYEVGDEIKISYNANVSDRTQTIKLLFTVAHETAGEQQFVVDTGVANISSTWVAQGLTVRGNYTISIQAYTGATIDDTSEGVFVSPKLKYNLFLLNKNEIGVMIGLNRAVNTGTYLTIPFKVVSKADTSFYVTGKLEKKNEQGQWVEYLKNDAGIRTSVNVQSYWAVGKLPEGTYKYTLTGFNSDRLLVSLISPSEVFDVTLSNFESIMPVTSNLIAWFDANEKRNTDTNKDVWENKNGYSQNYKIKLHDLNYSSNGWKHIDGLDDTAEGEFVLKFTGDSYGEMIQIVNGVEQKYNPFDAIRSEGQQGLSIELAFKTRCVGELNARVITCMDNMLLDTPGVAITYNKLYLNSSKQISNLDFMEEEWVHAALVVDKDIRTIDEVGQGYVENLNPTYSMRIYINGVLCSCASFIDDVFVDKANKTFPLILNACYNSSKQTYSCFGDCEIKFLRIYNGYLTSQDVLQNYISHIYNLDEQKEVADRNDISIVTLPKIVFKRKWGTGNDTNFDNLHAITDKKTSKKTCVSCVMDFYEPDGTLTQFEHLDVYLQGTSSLQYPIKNYQVKNYADNERKKKMPFYPPGKEEEWRCPCYTYTLKVDYMEQSHMNNTPTAVFYNSLIEDMAGGNKSKLSPARQDGYLDAIDGFPCIVYYNNGGENDEDVLVGSYMFNVHKDGDQLGFECDLYDEEGNVIGNGEDCCISYEATANSTDSAGCFYTLEESINSVYNNYVNEWWNAYLKETNQNSAQLPLETFKQMINNDEVDYQTFAEFKETYSVYDYIASDFEPRFAYNEDDEEATYGPMLNLVNWVSSCWNGDELDTDKFTDEFEEHLNKMYCMAYYLQMQVFTQIDNCGKNAMFDTWDGKIFYPRPYDMDSQMGLSNTGTETIEAHAELLPEISPYQNDGIYASYGNNDTVTELRYMSYNTKTSKLWNAFAKAFKEDIAKEYIRLRTIGTYTVENITNIVFGLTQDKIGEIYYNKDAASKYLSQTTNNSTEYLKMLHGNRKQKYKKFLTDRILFLDTIYGYYQSDTQLDTLNSEMSLRSDATVTETVRCYLGISVYTPMYIKVSVGSGMDAIIVAYVGPDSTYEDPYTGQTMEGTLFSFPIKASDKEVIIYGAGNIKQINRLEDLNVRDLVLERAQKLVDLNLSNSSRMITLSMGNNKFLRNLDCSYSRLLGTSGKELNLSNCTNLKTVDLSNTSLTAVTFPTDSNLTKINLKSSKIKAITIDGAEFLNEIDITGCDTIEGYSLTRCPKLEVLNVSNSPIKELYLSDCKNIHTVNATDCVNINIFNISDCPGIETLNFARNSSPVMEDLKLHTTYNLKYLYVNNSSTSKSIRLPKYLNEEEALKAALGQEAKLWDKLKTLNLESSPTTKIQYGAADVTLDAIDLTQLTNLTSLIIRGNTKVTEIKNIHYKGSIYELFNNCKALKTISGTIEATNNSGQRMFHECRELNNTDNLTYIFPNVTTLSYACSCMKKLTTKMLKKLLDAAGENLTDINNICQNYDSGAGILGTAADRSGRDMPSDLFAKCPNISNMSHAFAWGGHQYTTIPGNLLDPCAESIVNLGRAFTSGSLTNVGVGLLKNKPKLTDVASLFNGSTNLANYMHVDSNIFEGSPKIQNTSYMFWNCQKLKCSNLGLIFDGLTELTSCSYMFQNCYAITATIPNGLLANCVKLTNIDSLFGCCTGLTTLPTSLFRKNIADTNTLPSLTNARGVFGGCTKLTGEVPRTFFHGAEAINNLGESSNDGGYRGFFQDTKIVGYYDTIFDKLNFLTNVTNFFKNCKSLEYHYTVNDLGEKITHLNTISEDLFKNNTRLVYSPSMFYDCTKIKGFIPPLLFDSCRNTILNVSSMFYNCTGLSGIDQDGDLGLIGLSDSLFLNCKSLNYVQGFMQSCTGYSCFVSERLFSGCVSLRNTSSMFASCRALQGGLSRKLFDSCRNTLENVTSMFAGSTISGDLPEGDYRIVQGIKSYRVCLPSEEGAKQVLLGEKITNPETQISYSVVLEWNPDLSSSITYDGSSYVMPVLGDTLLVEELGLLSDCVNLTTTANMFSECDSITGGIPSDLFYSSDPFTTFKITTTAGMFYHCNGLNKSYIDTNTNETYYIPSDLFKYCPLLEHTNGMFQYCSLPTADLPNTLFDKQSKLINVANMFYSTNVSGFITQNFLKNCISSLNNAQGFFSYSKVTNIASGFLNLGGKNTRLQYIGGIFKGCGSLEGTSPEFWNKQKFPSILESSAGYYGALAGTKVSNLEDARAVNSNWVN